MHPLGRLVGEREDLDLPSRWWHRLIRVVYTLALLLVLVVGAVVAWETSPKPLRANVVVLDTLAGAFQRSGPTQNAASLLIAGPGELGLLKADETIDYVPEVFFGQSFCSAQPLQATKEIADFFSNRNRYSKSTISGTTPGMVAQSIRDGGLEQGACWFSDYLENDVKDAPSANILKFTFSPSARVEAKASMFLRFVGWTFVVHVVLAAVYYRGFVYIVCGPRRKSENVVSVKENPSPSETSSAGVE